MNVGIVVLEYPRAIREEKKNIDFADLLCLDLTNWSNPRS